MMKSSKQMLLAYDYDSWYDFGAKQGIFISTKNSDNSHILLNGSSGSGKSYMLNLIFARLALTENSKFYFIDFKRDEQFEYLKDAPRYYAYDKALEAFDEVYDIMKKRQSGEDDAKCPITLIWDEYVSSILSIQGEDKKKADKTMAKVAELLMLGRTLNTRLIVSTQRADATVFPLGSRMNYGIIVIIGAPPKSTYEMFLPKEYIEKIGDRQFKKGEGVALLQGSELNFIKVPTVCNMDKLQQICIDALTR